MPEKDEIPPQSPVPELVTSDGAQPIYFNSRHLPAPSLSYVAWLDVMGSKAAMTQSLQRSAHIICRLHIAILKHRKHPQLEVSPFMDGAYIRCPSQHSMLSFLSDVFFELAHEFCNAREHQFRFMPRCGLAYGSLIQGVDIPTNASKILGAHSNKQYRESIYLGYPMVQAFTSEASAPPFGVAIHESARSFAPQKIQPLSGLWWRWFSREQSASLEPFVGTLKTYFEWLGGNALSIGYSESSHKLHRQMAYEYFSVSTVV